jgi:hypothetical protein
MFDKQHEQGIVDCVEYFFVRGRVVSRLFVRLQPTEDSKKKALNQLEIKMQGKKSPPNFHMHSYRCKYIMVHSSALVTCGNTEASLLSCAQDSEWE